MRKSRRAFVLLVTPVAVFIWCIGWSIYWIEERKGRLKPDIANPKENVKLTSRVPQPKIKV